MKLFKDYFLGILRKTSKIVNIKMITKGNYGISCLICFTPTRTLPLQGESRVRGKTKPPALQVVVYFYLF